MGEALLDRKFEHWQNQLLDLGRRNKMINYRETKRATLKLIEPEFEEFLQAYEEALNKAKEEKLKLDFTEGARYAA
jgi:hypothetical protein